MRVEHNRTDASALQTVNFCFLNFEKKYDSLSPRMGATVFVQPLDLVKNRMQSIKVLKGEKRPTSLSVLMGVVRNEGVKVASPSGIFHTVSDRYFLLKQ